MDDLLQVAIDIERITSEHAENGAHLDIKSMSLCQRVFNEISEWFREELQWTEYTCLVASHCFMGIQYLRRAVGSPVVVARGAALHEEIFMDQLHDAYFEDLVYWHNDGENSFEGYVTRGRKTPRTSLQHTTMAWFLMFLKGLAWSMSTTGMAMGEPVPSSCFDHPRNVWIL